MSELTLLWYASLQKSALTPAPWVFMVVWPVLYGLMFLAMWQAPWVKTRWEVFLVQLVLNILWQVVFFQLHWLGVAMMMIGGLIGINMFILQTFSFYPMSFYLYLPYVLWLWFANYLMAFIWSVN